MCFHAENDPRPFIVLRLDATAVAKGETWDEKNARVKAERDAAAAARGHEASRQRQTDKQGGGTPMAATDQPQDESGAARARRVDDATARRDAANASAQAAADARNAAARERKAALEAARAARRQSDD